MSSLFDEKINTSRQLELVTLEGLSTAAIEGEVYEPLRLRSSISRKLGLSTAALPNPSREIDGLVDLLLDATENYSQRLTLNRLCGWQAVLFPNGYSGLHPIAVGKLRGNDPMQIVSGAIGKERVHYVAPARKQLPSELRQFLNWFNAPPKELDGLIRAGIAHLWFEVLHPFEDGNGRVGRALVDMALAQDEQSSLRLFSLSAQLMKKRNDYYAALEDASRSGIDITQWLLYFLEQINDAAGLSAKAISGVVRKAKFWLANSDVPLSDRQKKVLNRLLDASDDEFADGISNRIYSGMTHASPATSQRDLAALVELGVLQRKGDGRSARYVLVI